MTFLRFVLHKHLADNDYSLQNILQYRMSAQPGNFTVHLRLFEDVPNEILDNIASHLDQTNHPSLIQASKYLRAIDERRFFESVTIHSSANATFDDEDDLSDAQPQNLHLASFLRTMKQRPDLCDVVKSASIVVSNNNVPKSFLSDPRRTTSASMLGPDTNNVLSESERAGELLSLLTKLKSLKLDMLSLDVFDEEESALHKLWPACGN